MAAGLRLLGAEGGAEAVDLAQRGRRGLDVELAGLRQVGLAEVEVVGREQVPGLLPDGAGEDGRIHQGEAFLVEVVADRLLDLVADPGDRGLAPGPEPQMSMLEEESRPMLLGGDRVVGAGPQDLEAGHRHLVPARRSRLLSHHSGQRHTGLLRQRAERGPDGLGDLLLGQDALHDTRTVPYNHERDLPARPGRDDPAAQSDGRADVCASWLICTDAMPRPYTGKG